MVSQFSWRAKYFRIRHKIRDIPFKITEKKLIQNGQYWGKNFRHATQKHLIVRTVSDKVEFSEERWKFL